MIIIFSAWMLNLYKSITHPLLVSNSPLHRSCDLQTLETNIQQWIRFKLNLRWWWVKIWELQVWNWETLNLVLYEDENVDSSHGWRPVACSLRQAGADHQRLALCPSHFLFTNLFFMLQPQFWHTMHEFYTRFQAIRSYFICCRWATISSCIAGGWDWGSSETEQWGQTIDPVPGTGDSHIT